MWRCLEMKEYHIKFKTLKKKDPKQFRDWLRKWGFSRNYIVELLEDCDEFDPKDKSLRLLKLCEKYRDLLEDLIEELLSCV